MGEPLRDELCRQADKIARDCDRASIRDSLISAGWYRMNLWLGVASVLLAGMSASLAGAHMSGTQSFVDHSVVQLSIAMLASGSGILTSVVTFLAPAEKANVYHEYSNRYWALRDRIRRFVTIECISEMPTARLKQEFDKLLSERIELDSKHPLVPEWVYAQAGEKLKEKVLRNRRAEEAESASRSVQEAASNPAAAAAPAKEGDDRPLLRVAAKRADDGGTSIG